MKKELALTVTHVNELAECAIKLIQTFPNHKIFTFTGDLGSGKTTFIKAIVAALKSADSVSSPTYSIVNEYLSAAYKIYHIDLYRLETLDEALNIGIEEYLYNNQYCLIEWPGLIADLLPQQYIEVVIKHMGDNKRDIVISEKDEFS